jgi:hypothetical protein
MKRNSIRTKRLAIGYRLLALKLGRMFGYGFIIMESLQKGSIYTIKMEINPITLLKT